MTEYEILCLLGAPALIGSAIIYIVKKFGAVNKETTALKAGIQALLRDRLLQSYKHYQDKGWADTDDRMNWENMYAQYHALGSNGVMDDIRTKFFALPTSKPTE